MAEAGPWESDMTLEVVPLAEEHFVALREVLDTVAREKRFLAFTEAPPLDAAIAFYRGLLACDAAASVAMLGGQVVGWCDVLPTHGQARAHVGTLGIGLVPSARRRGFGRPLLEATLDRAVRKGLTRIELTVRADNLNAKALYERVGFVTEGLSRRAFRIDGEYFDAFSMALIGIESGSGSGRQAATS
jgi:RimJ/RimL family protein N-acetyltransferase